MDFLFKCPKNVDAVTIDFQQFDADEDGLFKAPIRYRTRLEDLGFVCLGEPPADVAGDQDEGADTEGEGEGAETEGEKTEGEGAEIETETETEGDGAETEGKPATGKVRRKRG